MSDEQQTGRGERRMNYVQTSVGSLRLCGVGRGSIGMASAASRPALLLSIRRRWPSHQLVPVDTEALYMYSRRACHDSRLGGDLQASWLGAPDRQSVVI